MKNRKEEVALVLLQKGIVRLRPEEPFVWRSGIRAPIYCDIRELLSFPKERIKIIAIFAEAVKEFRPQPEVIAGVETGGIPFAGLVADRMNLPLIYVRKERKDHGREKRIEGWLPPTKKNVAVIDDVISTGESLYGAANAIEQEAKTRVNVFGFCIFNYELKEFQKRFFGGGMEVFSLTNLSTLSKVAVEKGFWKKGEAEIVEQWRESV